MLFSYPSGRMRTPLQESDGEPNGSFRRPEARPLNRVCHFHPPRRSHSHPALTPRHPARIEQFDGENRADYPDLRGIDSLMPMRFLAAEAQQNERRLVCVHPNGVGSGGQRTPRIGSPAGPRAGGGCPRAQGKEVPRWPRWETDRLGAPRGQPEAGSRSVTGTRCGCGSHPGPMIAPATSPAPILQAGAGWPHSRRG